jgi:hypothetical protein
MSPEQRWSASPADLLTTSLHHERGTMIVDDLRALPERPMVIAEGTPVAPAMTGTDLAIWLLPTSEVQQARLATRRLAPGVNTLYQVLARQIEREVDEHGARTLTVDGSRSIEDTVAEVEGFFEPALRKGPTAGSVVERRRLLRYANDAVVAQYRAYAARPWVSRRVLATVHAFACECGHSTCEADVELVIGAFPGPGPSTLVLAAGHGSPDRKPGEPGRQTEHRAHAQDT